MKDTGRVAALDGLRGIAILGVVMFHVAEVYGRGPVGGHLGVPVFFVLSGYLITSLLMAERARTGRVDLPGFYLRRAARLLPLLAVVAPLVVVFAAVNGADLHRVVLGGAATMLYVANLAILAVGYTDVAEWGFAWSLSQEEQFYLVWPLVLLAVLALRRRRLAIAVLVVAAAVAWATRTLAMESGHQPIAMFAPWNRWDSLAMGCALALWNPAAPRALARWLAPAALVTIGVLYATQDIRDLGTYTVGMTLAPLAAAVAIATGTHSRVLNWAPLRHLGRISYGVYLWHAVVPLMVAALPLTGLGRTGDVVVWLVASLALAQLSWHYFEQPINRWAHRTTSRRYRPAGPRRAAAVAPTAGSAGRPGSPAAPDARPQWRAPR